MIVAGRELLPKNPLFWTGVAKEIPTEIAGSLSSRNSKATYELNKAQPSVSLLSPLTFEIRGDHNNDLLNNITENDIQGLRDDNNVANKSLVTSLGLLRESIINSGLEDCNKEKLRDALNTIKLGLFSKEESKRPNNQDFIKALIILKNNLPKINGSREAYAHVILDEVKHAVESAMNVLEGKLQPA